MDAIDSKIIQSVIKKNRLTEPMEAKRFSSGVVNRVYDIGGKYALKIEGEGGVAGEPILKPAADMTAMLLGKGAKVPKILDYGTVDGSEYILMEKVSGKNLSYDWMAFSDSQKEKVIEQLAEQLQIWHSIRFDNYCITMKSQKPFKTLRPAIERVTLEEINKIQKDKLSKEFLPSVETLEKFYYDNIPNLDETGTAVLCHNDIHLENIFHQNRNLTAIIDLDWISQAPKDFELWKILDVVHAPKITVEEHLEPLFGDYQMIKELGWLKKYYPKLFEVNNLANRIRIYYLDPLIEKAVDCQNGRWGENTLNQVAKKVRDFYQSSWLDDLLN